MTDNIKLTKSMKIGDAEISSGTVFESKPDYKHPVHGKFWIAETPQNKPGEVFTITESWVKDKTNAPLFKAL